MNKEIFYCIFEICSYQLLATPTNFLLLLNKSSFKMATIADRYVVCDVPHPIGGGSRGAPGARAPPPYRAMLI